MATVDVVVVVVVGVVAVGGGCGGSKHCSVLASDIAYPLTKVCLTIVFICWRCCTYSSYLFVTIESQQESLFLIVLLSQQICLI